uniref:Uncharacterized protein n=1 Tax=Hyaloperonospora arabidopsidis (strain Emoy2) TaxID=559515 RepID=M4BVR0_HYAAE
MPVVRRSRLNDNGVHVDNPVMSRGTAAVAVITTLVVSAAAAQSSQRPTEATRAVVVAAAAHCSVDGQAVVALF